MTGAETPTVVFIPGHLCGPWLYHGMPELVAGPVAFADIGQDDSLEAMARRMLDRHRGRLVLVGLSMGGMVAMEAMAADPDRIAGAMLIATDPWPARAVERAWRAGEVETVSREGLGGYARRFAAKFVAHRPEAPMGGIAHLMAETPISVFETQARALDTRRDIIPLIRGFPAPVEVMVGAEDRVCPPKLHAPIALALSDARLTTVPDAGHLLTRESPGAVAERLLALLDRVGARAGASP